MLDLLLFNIKQKLKKLKNLVSLNFERKCVF